MAAEQQPDKEIIWTPSQTTPAEHLAPKEWVYRTLSTNIVELESKSPNTVFVAYPYAWSKEDYRSAFAEVGDEFGVEFLYADERITNKQILQKITAMIQEATFSIFDITTWNPNVALELGIAIGRGEDYYILFNPEHDENQAEVPADLGGIDRLEYKDFSSLKGEVKRLLEQQFGAPGDEEEGTARAGDQFNEQIDALKAEVPKIVGANPGIQMGGIASQLGVGVEYAQNITRPLLDDVIETRGQRRGTRYFLAGEAPAETSDGDNGEKPEE